MIMLLTLSFCFLYACISLVQSYTVAENPVLHIKTKLLLFLIIWILPFIGVWLSKLVIQKFYFDSPLKDAEKSGRDTSVSTNAYTSGDSGLD
jgi:hypothetical protein